MELSGLVWSTKKLRPYMERSFVWFVTDHRPNVDIFDKSLQTISTSRSNLSLQTWGIYLSQFWGRMQVVYSKGANLDCPDALSRLSYEVSANAAHLRDWAASLGKAPGTEDFEVSEAFAITRSSARHPPTNQAAPDSDVTAEIITATPGPVATKPAADVSPDATSPAEDQQFGLTLVTTVEIREALRQAVLTSQRFSAIRSKLLNEGAN
jgi:hypothetical protein